MSSSNKKIIVSSFNIRCFGADGVYDGKIGQEGRISFLNQFIKNQLSEVDVLILQEILDTSFLKEILPPDFSFKTYEHDFKRHMKIVICYRNTYDFTKTQIVENTAINYKTSRPAFYGLLINKISKKPVSHIIGVHLKSGIHHTDNRLKQVRAIKDFITNLDLSIPVVIGGDFNSHSKTATKRDNNDMAYFEEILSLVNLKRVKNSNFTYYTLWERECLDHILVSKDALLDDSLWTYNIEEHSPGFDSPYSIKTYYAEISDHLPIKISFKVKNN